MSTIPVILAPLLIGFVWLFLIFRFGFFNSREISGRISFSLGGLFLFAATGWEIVELVSDYSDWFVSSAYGAINLAQFVLGAIGALLSVVGLALYADYWQVRREDIEDQFSKLNILEHLHHDARQPYHLLELLNISLREILVQYPMAAGAILLVNRNRRQFVPTSSSGLRKEELAYLEYYPLERNLVSQAVELGDPLLASRFEFIERTGKPVPSRFNSVLVLPLVSGMKKIGALVLFSEEQKFFGRGDIRYLSPVAQWLSEKIHSGRLTRELNRAQNQAEASDNSLRSYLQRIHAVVQALASSQRKADFCRALVGVAESESAHVGIAAGGDLNFWASSEPLFDLTESYRAALVDGIGRGKPLVINQEAREDDRTQLVQSSLIYPIEGATSGMALIFTRKDRAFAVDDRTARQIEGFTGLAGLLTSIEDYERNRISRRQGFEAILRLLRPDSQKLTEEQAVRLFADTLATALPNRPLLRNFRLNELGEYRSLGETETDPDILASATEGSLGRAAASGQVLTVGGVAEVRAHLDDYHEQVRSDMTRWFGERGVPSMVAYCPLNDGRSVLAAGLYGLNDTERAEWRRLLTLASGLHNLLAASAAKSEPESLPSGPERSVLESALASQVSKLLSAVVGGAELIGRERSEDRELKEQLTVVVENAEAAAALVARSDSTALSGGGSDPESAHRLDRVIETELSRHNVSGDLFMAGGRPREIRMNVEPVGPIGLDDGAIVKLFNSVLDRFSALVEEEDVMTLATYQRDDHVYFDVSRHRPNLPPVKKVAGFGRYLLAEDAFRSRPGDIYLKYLVDSDAYYAVDAASPIPAYLSFRFRRTDTALDTASKEDWSTDRMLAIDDQQVILDLIVAMGRSLGYRVDTASSGEIGLRLAQDHNYRVILTDLALPGMSGLETARRLHQLLPQAPIVLVTGWGTNISRSDLEAAGIQEMLHKPFRVEQLTAVVRSVVEKQPRA